MAISLIKNPDERNDPPKPLLEHLIALRQMIVHCGLSWGVGMIVAGCFAPKLLRLLTSPAGNNEHLLAAYEMTTSFNVLLEIALWGGFVLAFPFITYAILRFIFPALTNREKVIILTGLIVSTTLFVTGAILAYLETLPLVVATFKDIGDWMGIKQAGITITSYMSIILKLIVAFGLVFQVPLLLVILGWLGIISSETLRESRRFAIVFSFVLAMFLTPPDPMSQILMAVPLCVMYEAAIWIIWLKERVIGRKRK